MLELYIVTDSTDANEETYGLTGTNTGALRRYSLSDGSAIGSSIALSSGAGSVDARSGVVSSNAGAEAVKHDFTTTFDDDGESVELQFVAQTGRRLWLRLR